MALSIVGAGGHGRVVADVAEAAGFRDICFVDERWPEVAMNLVWPVVGAGLQDIPLGHSVAIAVGNCSGRLALLEQALALGFDVPALVHPTAYVSAHARLGAGTVVMPQAAVNAGAALGKAVIVNTGATIDHDCRIGDGVHVSPGAHLAGAVRVGARSWIGIGAVVREGIHIGADVTVGAGAAVVTNTGDNGKLLGVPARERP